MAVNETKVTGKKYRVWDNVNSIWKRLSFWTKSEDVEMGDGNSAETNLGAIKGITTSTSVTETGYAADATTVATLNTNLNTHKTSSDHDDRYYTEVEVNTLLAKKQDTLPYSAGSETIAFSDSSGNWIKDMGSIVGSIYREKYGKMVMLKLCIYSTAGLSTSTYYRICKLTYKPINYLPTKVFCDYDVILDCTVDSEGYLIIQPRSDKVPANYYIGGQFIYFTND